MKNSIRYVCQQCGSFFPRWLGRCSECGEWNSLVEEKVVTKSKSSKSTATGVTPQKLCDIKVSDIERMRTGVDELDRVFGGGFVRGSVTLLGGDPGIGKSTICLQLCELLSRSDLKSLYVSGEESYEQVKLRAKRLKSDSSTLIDILCETDIDDVYRVATGNPYDLIVIDSIQTITSLELNSPAGSVGQLKECTAKIVHIAKSFGIPVVIVGHVNKEGSIAGPKIIEHMVDTVLYFEGQTSREYRIIRSIKNRFGSTNEIGIFQMCSDGLIPVVDPFSFFISHDGEDFAPGNIIVPALEGTRPIMHEVQALVSYSPAGIPRRTAMGIDPTKLAIILAVLEKRAGLQLHNQDVYVKVVGGMKIDDPACDLAIACALYSSFRNVSLKKNSVVLGELGLSGEIRNVNFLDARLKEISKLGLEHAYIPKQKNKLSISSSLNVIEVNTLSELINLLI